MHKLAGCTREDAIILLPNAPSVEINGAATGPGCTDTRWFRLDTELPFSGRAQALQFFVPGSIDVADSYEIRLLAGDGLTAIASSNDGIIRRTDSADNDRRMFMTVKPRRETISSRYHAEWTTNMTVIHGPMSLLNIEQTDLDIFGEDDDDVRISLFIGGVERDHEVRARDEDGGDFDTGHVAGISESKIAPIRFLPDEPVSIVLREDDADCHDFLVSEPAGSWVEHPGYVDILYDHEDGACPTADRGHYLFSYQLSHGLQSRAP